MIIKTLPAAVRLAQPWRNGAGVTFEIASAGHPRRANDFLWRVSIADVAQPGPFSRFAGHERLISVIDGAGMELRGLQTHPVALRPFGVVRFDGAATVEGLLPHGAVRDFNVIFDPASCSAELTFVVGPAEVASDAATVLVVNVAETVCAWSCASERGTLARFDALQVAGGLREPLRWQAGGRVAVVRLGERAGNAVIDDDPQHARGQSGGEGGQHECEAGADGEKGDGNGV